MKPGDALLEAAKKQAEGEVAVPEATLKTPNYAAGIGEHPRCY